MSSIITRFLFLESGRITRIIKEARGYSAPSYPFEQTVIDKTKLSIKIT